MPYLRLQHESCQLINLIGLEQPLSDRLIMKQSLLIISKAITQSASLKNKHQNRVKKFLKKRACTQKGDNSEKTAGSEQNA
jgi:hypothetical protein